MTPQQRANRYLTTPSLIVFGMLAVVLVVTQNYSYVLWFVGAAFLFSVFEAVLLHRWKRQERQQGGPQLPAR